MSSEITLAESKRIIALEKIIEKGLSNFIQVGEALAEIRDSKLYRVEYETFEDYCRKKWGFSRIQAHRLMAAAEVADVLPIGNKPRTESQARPLTKLPPEQQPAAWQKAVEIADGEQPTAKQVEEAVNDMIRPIPKIHLSAEAEARVTEAGNESEILWTLKRYWRQATKKDKATFTKWAESH